MQLRGSSGKGPNGGGFFTLSVILMVAVPINTPKQRRLSIMVVIVAVGGSRVVNSSWVVVSGW